MNTLKCSVHSCLIANDSSLLINQFRKTGVSSKLVVIRTELPFNFVEYFIFQGMDLILITFLFIGICFCQLTVNESGEILLGDSGITGDIIDKCFTPLKEIYSYKDVKLNLVESNSHPFKYVLKEFPTSKKELFNLEVEGYCQLPRSSYFPKYYGSFRRADTDARVIIMEFIDGKNLKEIIEDVYCDQQFKHQKSNLIKSFKFIAAELASAIQILHDNNIVHRDIKPDNIIIDKNGHVKLFDFGFSTKLTNLHDRMDKFMGTMDYIAPEFYNSPNYNYQVDWFSYGITISYLFGEFLSERIIPLMGRYNILNRVYNYVGEDERSLIQSCTALNPISRTKSLKDLKQLEIFRNVDWDEMRSRHATPPDELIECITVCNSEKENEE